MSPRDLGLPSLGPGRIRGFSCDAKPGGPEIEAAFSKRAQARGRPAESRVELSEPGRNLRV